MAKSNKGRKFFATTATAALVASAIVPVASAAQINDFNSISSYAQEAVQDLNDRGIIKGDQKGNFNPKSAITRAEAATILTNALELEGSGSTSFTDVKKSAWYYEAIDAAVANGIFQGQGAGKFNPSANLTRSEAAIILVDAFGLEGSANLSTFKDSANVKSWAEEALSIAVANEVMKGDDKGNLNPNASITRQDFALMYFRTEAAETEEVSGSVKAINATTVEVTFEEEVEDAKALNFAIEGLDITNAAIKQSNKKTVVLTTSAQTADVEYTVTLDGEAIGKFKGISAVIPTGVTVNTTSVQGVVGQQVTITAEVKVAEGQSKAGIPVTFNVDPFDAVNTAQKSSLNKAQVVEVETDDKGVATYKYTQYNAGEDQVVAYATGNAASRDFAKVYWGVKPILTLATKDAVSMENGKAKTYTATYLDPVTGTPIINKELNVTFKENIDATVSNDSTAVATDVNTGSTVKPFESATEEKVLKVKTNAKGEATFTVTGRNTSVTPIVYVDSDKLNTAGYDRINTRDLQATTETTKFVGGVYTFKFNKEEQFEAVVGKPFTYEVEVIKADGKPYAGGTATVALHELIDSSISTTTTAFIVNNSKVKAIPGKAGVYTIELDSNGKAKFDVQANTTEVSATPVVWVDINSASNIEGTLEKEEPFKLAGSVVFRNEVINGAKLENTSDVTGIYGISGTGLQQPNYQITLLDQAGSNYSKDNYAINRVTYTLTNTGNSAVDLTLKANNFNIDTISNNDLVGSVVIAAGGSVTVTGVAIGNPKSVSLDVANAKAGTVNVVGSVTTSTRDNNGVWTNHNSYYSAGTDNTQWVAATPAATEVTGVVKGYQTVDGYAAWGYALVLVDGSTTYQIVKYDQNNSYFTGTLTDFNRLTVTNASGLETAISLEDRISLKNNEIRLINADSSSKPGQVKGNLGDADVATKALADAIKAAEDAKLEASDYTPESWKAFEDALKAAKAVPATATDAEKTAAAKALNDAKAALEAPEAPAETVITSAKAFAPNSIALGLDIFTDYEVTGTVAEADATKKVELKFGFADETVEAVTATVDVKDGKFAYATPSSIFEYAAKTVTLVVDGKEVGTAKAIKGEVTK